MIGHYWEGPRGGPDLEIMAHQATVDITLVTEDDLTITLTPAQAVEVARALYAYAHPEPAITPVTMTPTPIR